MGFSQKSLAEKCGTAHTYIRQIESGNRCPSFALIGKIAGALQIEPYQLFFDETVKSNKSAQIKHMELIKEKLLETMSNNINNAFGELKKIQ